MGFKFSWCHAIAMVFIPSLLFAFSRGNGTEGNPFRIATAAQLDSIRYYCGIADSGTYFKLSNDIDLTTWLSPGNPGYNTGAFWLPIGSDGNNFYGKLDGNNHKIIGLKINRSSTDYIGLFGYIGTDGKLQNIGVEIKKGDTVKGHHNVGILAGKNDGGKIFYCYATGVVSGATYYVGGIVGGNSGTMNNCYATGAVSGVFHYVGGLAGYNSGTVSNCYATGAVSGFQYTGGLVGYNYLGTVINSYWDKQTTGQSTSSGSESSYGRTTAEMIIQSTFVGWNFASIWAIKTGMNSGYPYLQWQLPTDFIGTWTGQGVYSRNSNNGAWVKLGSPADLIATGDLDGDGTDDLIGIWPSQGGVWVKYSASGAWAKLSSTARHITAGDMNGDGRADLVGTWDGQGTYYRNSVTGAWVKMGSAATLVTTGDLDGDGIDDLIGIWPSQGGVWVKYSTTGAWVKLSSTAMDIAAGDMNGDGRADLVGTWDGQGTYYRNTISSVWVKLGSPATQVTTGDLDGDGTDDLIGIWPSQGGVWAKYSKTGAWAKLSSTAIDIATGKMRGGAALDIGSGPVLTKNDADESVKGPGSVEVRPIATEGGMPPH
jgi:hypothetical protein